MNYMKYNRTFVMMEAQTVDFAAKEAPIKGYLKVETGNNKGAMRCVVQNLRPYGRGEYVYKLIFFGKKKERTIHAILGGLVVNRNGNGETYFRFDPLNFDGKGNRYDEFSAAIVAAASSKNSKESLHPILKGDMENEGVFYERSEERTVAESEPEPEENFGVEEAGTPEEDFAAEEVRAPVETWAPEKRVWEKEMPGLEEAPETENIPEAGEVPEPEEREILEETTPSIDQCDDKPNYNRFYNEYLLQFCDYTCKVAGYYEDVNPFEEDTTEAKWKKMINVGNLPLVSPGAHYFATQYHHYLFGAKPNAEGRAVRYFFAIPGRALREEQPDGGRSGFLRWQAVTGSEGPGRGYGYWILAVDPATGNIEEA